MNEDNNSKKITIIAVSVIVIVLAIILLVKCCNVKEYKITFDTDGGNKIEAILVKEDGTIDLPKDPVKEGYKFIGWYYNDKKFDENTKVSEDMVLEARWERIIEGIELDREEVSLEVGDTYTLSYELGEDIDEDSLVFSSSKSSVVSVDKNGNLKAKKAGKATITIETKDGKYSATLEVTVTKSDDEEVEVVAVNKITIEGSKKMVIGGEQQLKATIEPENATNKDVIWTSSDESIAKVSASGKVSALNPGKVTITATAKDGSKVSASIEIEVDIIHVKAVKIVGETSVVRGKTLTLKANITPSNATNKKVTWTSSDEKVATIDKSGVLTAKTVGKTTITVVAEDGKVMDSIDVTVTPIPYTVTFDKGYETEDVTVNENETVEELIPSREGYNFGGWYEDKDCTKPFDFETPITKDITLYAKWYVAPEVTSTLPEEVYPDTEIDYTITTSEVGDYDQRMVRVWWTLTTDGEEVPKDSYELDYFETDPSVNDWRSLKPYDAFGPLTGFPLTEGATSKFRVNFKTPGNYEYTLTIKDVETEEVLGEYTLNIKVDKMPELSITLPDEIVTDFESSVEYEMSFADAEDLAGTYVLPTWDVKKVVEDQEVDATMGDDYSIEYYEPNGEHAGEWLPLTVKYFGSPTTGFPIDPAAKSQFRVTFKQAGTYVYYVKVVKFGTEIVLNEYSRTITVKKAPTLNSGIPGTATVTTPESQDFQEFEIGFSDLGSFDETTYVEVKGTITDANGAIVDPSKYHIEYWETGGEGANSWLPLTGESYGPVGQGFPLDTTVKSKFRIKFYEAGTYTYTITVIDFNTKAVLLQSVNEITVNGE